MGKWCSFLESNICLLGIYYQVEIREPFMVLLARNQKKMSTMFVTASAQLSARNPAKPGWVHLVNHREVL
jgi:hypothetical protein